MNDPYLSACSGPCNLHFKIMSPRAIAGQNLIVGTTNAALRRGLISLECEPFKPATFEFDLNGIPVIGHVRGAGYDEVLVHATAAPTEQGRRSIGSCVVSGYDREHFGGAVTFEWLERRAGRYLQGPGTYYASRPITKALSALRIEPLGFSAKPIMTSPLSLRGY